MGGQGSNDWCNMQVFHVFLPPFQETILSYDLLEECYCCCCPAQQTLHTQQYNTRGQIFMFLQPIWLQMIQLCVYKSREFMTEVKRPIWALIFTHITLGRTITAYPPCTFSRCVGKLKLLQYYLPFKFCINIFSQIPTFYRI